MDDDMADAATEAAGVIQCLRMLADEVAVLNLSRTLAALTEAIETCEAEACGAALPDAWRPQHLLH